MINAKTKDNIYMSDLFEIWLENQKYRVAKSTYQSYEDIISRVWKGLRAFRLEDISIFVIQREINKMSYMGLAPSTIKRYYYCLHASLDMAKLYGFLECNPSDGVQMPKMKVRRNINILQKEEIKSIALALEHAPELWQLFIKLAYFSGLRRSELIALKVGDLDFQNNKIYVSKSAYYDSVKKKMVEKAPKSLTSCREVFIAPSLMYDLKSFSEKKDRAEYLFTFTGKMMNSVTPTHYFYKLCSLSGIACRGFHALRHTHASFLLANGVSLQAVSARLGHSSLLTTQKYIHVYDEDDYNASLLFEMHKKKDVVANVLPERNSVLTKKHKVEATRFELTTSTSLM